MTRSLQNIVVDFDALGASDFDWNNTEANGWERLADLCDEMAEMDDVVKCAPTMFRTMERLDSSDLGSPGPLVHTLESWSPGYERFLTESMRRKPSPLAVWMVNRILNTASGEAGDWLDLLHFAARSPDASEYTKSEAKKFIERNDESKDQR